jgi:CRISPR-associated exonuclease Cas4
MINHLRIGMSMDLSNNISIPINIIREWCFCPRVVYYQELLKINAHKPLWVKQGEDSHSKISHLEKRRSFHRYGLDAATRHFNVSLKSNNYGFHGIADWILETDDQIYIVEYKINPNPNSLGHKLQIIAYAMLAEELYSKPCRISFLVSQKKSYEIMITEDLKEKVLLTVANIQTMLINANKPNSSATNIQCIQCQYLNFCNDRL